MKKRWLLVVPAVGITLGALSTVRAFDHGDAPGTQLDRAADIADVYAFMRPEPNGGGFNPSSHLVMVMTFDPTANATSTPSPAVDYIFRVRALDPATLEPLEGPNAKIICNFQSSTPVTVLCNVNGTPVTTTLGETDGGATSADARVFAGLRSDPAFADVPKIRSAIAEGQLPDGTSGTNTFQGKNVMSIVVEINVARVLFFGDAGGSAANPVLSVSGETKRN